MSDLFEIVEPTKKDDYETIYRLKSKDETALLLKRHDWSYIGDSPIKFFSIKEDLVDKPDTDSEEFDYETEYEDSVVLKCKETILGSEYREDHFLILCEYISDVLYNYELLNIKFDSPLNIVLYRVPINTDFSLNFDIMDRIIQNMGNNDQIDCLAIPRDIVWECEKALKFMKLEQLKNQKYSNL